MSGRHYGKSAKRKAAESIDAVLGSVADEGRLADDTLVEQVLSDEQ